jgi:transposase-like protein
MAELCRRFEVSRTVGYKWRNRYLEGGTAALADRSRRPHHSPQETPGEMTDAILALREKHPRWGARKLRRLLLNAGFGEDEVPAASTVNDIARAGLLEAGGTPRPVER